MCNIQQRETHGNVGNIQPELYRQDGGAAHDLGKDAMDTSTSAIACGSLHFTLKYDPDIEGLVVKVSRNFNFFRQRDGAKVPFVLFVVMV